MKGLTEAQRRALMPVGPPGEYVGPDVLAELVRDGRGRWTQVSPKEWEFEPTELGLLALRTCPRDQAPR